MMQKLPLISQLNSQPVPEQWQPLANSSPVLLMSMASSSIEYPFGQFGSAVPPTFSARLLFSPNLLMGGRVKNRENFDAV